MMPVAARLGSRLRQIQSLPQGGLKALVERCAVVVSGGTLAMHLAVALSRRAVAIFGPTCVQEIDLFGGGAKIVWPIGCAPCYKRACDFDPHCMDNVTAEMVVESVLGQLDPAIGVELSSS